MWGIVRAALFAALAVGPGCGTASAQSLIGKWMVDGQRDRFGDGGTFVAMTESRGSGMAFAVRCIRREWSLALLPLGSRASDFEPRARYKVKLKVDALAPFDASALALNAGLLQIETIAPMIGDILGGRELAVRVRSETGGEIDVVFGIGNARKALAAHLKECPKVD